MYFSQIIMEANSYCGAHDLLKYLFILLHYIALVTNTMNNNI